MLHTNYMYVTSSTVKTFDAFRSPAIYFFDNNVFQKGVNYLYAMTSTTV